MTSGFRGVSNALNMHMREKFMEKDLVVLSLSLEEWMKFQ